MKALKQKRPLEDVPEESEAGWKSGTEFLDGGLHIPLDTSTSQASEHRRESVAALSQMGQVKNRLAMWEPKTDAAQQQPVRRSWNKPWKKPKQEDQAPAEAARTALKPTLAAMQQSVPQPAGTDTGASGTPRRGAEALTPRRSSGESTPRGKAALSSPFLKQVQELFSGSLRRSGSSNLGHSAQSGSHAEGSREDFSPLGGGMATDIPLSGASEPLSPSQSRAVIEDIAKDAGTKSLASQLASEAASNTAQRRGRFSLSLRKAKSPSAASQQPQTPEPSPTIPEASFKAAEPVSKAATADLPSNDIPVSPCSITTMTLGALDISQQRKRALRSPQRIASGGAALHHHEDKPQPRTPESGTAADLPSPTLLSIQKLVATQAAAAVALQETGRARAVAAAVPEAQASCENKDGCVEEGLAVEISKASDEATEDDSLMPLQSSDSPRAGTHHRGSRRSALEDTMQVTSPICEKTDLKDILAHARSTEGPATASNALGDSSSIGIPAVEAAPPVTVEAAVSSPSDALAATHEGALATEAELSGADNVCPTGASEFDGREAHADAQGIDITEAEPVDSASETATDSTPAALAPEEALPSRQGNQGSPSKYDSEFTGSSASLLVGGAEDEASTEKPHVESSTEEAQAHELPEAEGPHATPSPAARVLTTEPQVQGQPAAADDKTDEVKPVEGQHTQGSNAGLRVEVPEARVRCSTPLYGPDSPARILDSLDSPLLQATLEEPSPAHISLQAHSDAATPEIAKCPTEDLPACDATTAPQKRDVSAPGESSSPRANANVPALDMDAISSPVVPSAPKDGFHAESPAVPSATEEPDTGTQNDTAASPIALTATEQTGAEIGAGASTPEPSPSAERLVSERSLDEAEFSLLREVMSKPLDPADQERVQAIADGLFKDMQRKEEAAVSADVGRSPPQFSLTQQVSPCAPVNITDVSAEETLDSSLLQDEPPVPALHAPADTRRLAETPPLSPRTALTLSPVRSPTVPMQRRSLSPLGRRSMATPPLPSSGKSGSSAASSELDSPLEEAMDELISHICDIEHLEVPLSTAKKVAQAEEQRTADIAPVRLDMGAATPQEPTPEAAVTDALADALAALQAYGPEQEEAAEVEALQNGGAETGAATGTVIEEALESDGVESQVNVVEAAADVIQDASSEQVTGSDPASAPTAALVAEEVTAAPTVHETTAKSPAPALPEGESALQQATPVTRRSASKSLSPSPRRRPTPLQTAMATNDENAFPSPASPATSAHSLPRSPSPAARSPGSKQLTPKSAGAMRAPLSSHRNYQTLVQDETDDSLPVDALVEGAGNSTEGTGKASKMAVLIAESNPEEAADSSKDSAWQPSPAVLPGAEDALKEEQELLDGPNEYDEQAAATADSPPAYVQSDLVGQPIPATQLAAEMETPVRGLHALQAESCDYADDELLTPGSVVPFPGFGEHIAGGLGAEEATPSTAPRVADPAPFLSNNNVVFSPDTPAEALSEASASIANERSKLRMRTPPSEASEGQQTRLETKFNLEDFSPRAARRISTGHTPPLHPCSARAAVAVPEDLPSAVYDSAPPRLSSTVDSAPVTSPQEVAASAQDLPSSQSTSHLHTPVAAPPEPMGDLFTPKAGETMVDEEDSTIDSPAFDESFAMDAQLVLGGLITPAAAVRPEAAQHIGPDAQEALNFASTFRPSTHGQRAYEMVEEAAAEAGLLSTDSQRLINVLKPVIEGMLEDLEQQQRLLEEQDKSEQLLRSELQVIASEEERLRAQLQKALTENTELQKAHAQTKQEFKILYHEKYVPLKEEHGRCSSEMQRLRDSRDAAKDTAEKWRAQVATAQLQVRKADLDVETAMHRIEQLQDELQGCRTEAEQSADALAAAEAEALRASRKSTALEAQLRALQAECTTLKAAVEEAETEVSAAQVARDRATKDGYAKDKEAEELRRRLRSFKAENDKFAGVKAQLQAELAAAQDALAEEKAEGRKLRKLCDGLMTDLEVARGK
ncbi:hypothetical protein COCOBI_11-2790 [Coccomyxa sp. Obi]|nr:hypothetical protein COCOBI_11-2790 [Coccomyxa sp. Obi]